MPIDELGGGPQWAKRGQLLRGRVVAPAPADATDTMYAVAINYSGSRPFEIPGPQWAKNGAVLPTVGSLCLIAFDDDGDAWAPVWS